MATELLFTDMSRAFGPAEHFCEQTKKDKWRVLDVGTAEYEGKMLMAGKDATPEDLRFSPKLDGWYKIYLAIPFLFPNVCPEVTIKLSSDDCFSRAVASPHGLSPVRWMTMHECLWRCADMTGEDIFISRKAGTAETIFALAAIRFVKMTDEEVASYLLDNAQKDTRNIYAFEDFHGVLCMSNTFSAPESFRPVVRAYRGSDVEWLAVESVRGSIQNNTPAEDDPNALFYRPCDERVHQNIRKTDLEKTQKKIVEWGHEDGLKISFSVRMGSWGMLPPFDECYFENKFFKDHPALRCVDRNGDVIPAMSYAFDEVQEYVINELLFAAKSGCDAVTLLSCRGIPYLLFEKPVADRFFEKYGELPYELPLDDERVNAVHTEIMTEFFRKIRSALDQQCGKNKVQLHFVAPFSLQDSKLLGFDCERLVKEKLVDVIVTYPLRCVETFNGDVWQDEKKEKIDLEKYTKHERTQIRSVMRLMNFDFEPPFINHRGEPFGPATQKQRVREWTALEEQNGVKVYFEIMPRDMQDTEFKRRALELYDFGAKRFGFWDAAGRVAHRGMWALAGKIGHKTSLKDFAVGDGVNYRNYTIYSIAGKDFSRYDPVWGS